MRLVAHFDEQRPPAPREIPVVAEGEVGAIGIGNALGTVDGLIAFNPIVSGPG
jgi:hypothetical protein